MIVGTVADLEVVNIRVAPVLEGVVAEVTTVLEDVNVKVACFLEDVDVTVASTRVAVVKVATVPEVVRCSWIRRVRVSREQRLARHVCSVGLLVIE